MDIPDTLVNQIREGNAVLFLGAGASRDAQSKDARKCPTASDLARELADRFLGGKYKDAPLNQIAGYAISETDLATVQMYLRSLFLELLPTPAHSLVPTFTWYGLATTNYDLLLEDAYETAKQGIQSLRPMIESSDRVDANLRDPSNVLYLKLHGCITRVTNPECPLILTTEQYIEYRQGRLRLFNIFADWGYEHPIILAGHSLQDSDLQAVINELTNAVGSNRPRYYMVAPDADDIKNRYWETKKITTLKGTFADFMSAIDALVPTSFRSLGVLSNSTRLHEIEKRFKIHTTLSKSALQFLQNDVDYVNSTNATVKMNPKDFYKGFAEGFSPIEQNLDVKRRLADDILSDYFLDDPQQMKDRPEVLLLKAHAGAGKSILLKRVAWDAAKKFDRIVLFLRPNGLLSVSAIQEIISSCKERVYFFIDNATDRVREIQSLLKNIGQDGQFLTLVLADRTNEWNVQGQVLSLFVTDEYELRYLSMPEIDQLLSLLEKHKALGTLEKLGNQERRDALAERAGRQLLVALHEATFGLPFEDIIVDEFQQIVPLEAQRIYLTVCVLNRLDVPVRAGIISRIHGIPFTEFKQKFFAPLEHVVFTHLDPLIRDHVYLARHPHIAEIVFQRILTNVEDRFDIYIKCLKALNVSYSADWQAFWKLVRGRTLLDLFPDPPMVKILYDVAKATVGDDPHLLHQIALYEMHRPNGNLSTAATLLARASQAAPYDSTIKHSIAELKLRMADGSGSDLEKSKLLKDAADICRNLISSENENAYGHHTLVKVSIRTFRDSLQGGASDEIIEKQIKEIEKLLFDYSQQFPGDSFLLTEESEFAQLLNDDKRAMNAMKKAFDVNPRNSFIAVRLANIEREAGRPQEALGILKKALEVNASDKRLHFTYAKLLMDGQSTSGDELSYHLRRAFTDGDTNYHAQLLYARQLFINKDIDGSKRVFAKLRNVNVPPQISNQLHYPIPGERFRGKISRLDSNYGFIARDGSADWIYVHRFNVSGTTWKNLTFGTRVEFSIAFSFRGVNAFELQILGGVADKPAQLDLPKMNVPEVPS
jgi:cold shock CspA family protein